MLVGVEGGVLGSPCGRDGGVRGKGENRSGSVEVEAVGEGDLEGKKSCTEGMKLELKLGPGLLLPAGVRLEGGVVGVVLVSGNHQDGMGDNDQKDRPELPTIESPMACLKGEVGKSGFNLCKALTR